MYMRMRSLPTLWLFPATLAFLMPVPLVHRPRSSLGSIVNNQLGEDATIELLLLTCGGLEPTCCELVEDYLHPMRPGELVHPLTLKETAARAAPKGWSGGEAGVGKVKLRVDVDRMDLAALVRLLEGSCGVQLVLAFICHHHAEFENSDSVRKTLASQTARLRRGEQVWRRWRGREDTCEDAPGGLKFRASCVRDGNHSFKSTEVMRAVGAGVMDALEAPEAGVSWVPTLDGFEAECLALLHHQDLTVGLSLRDYGGHRGKYTCLPADASGPFSAPSRWLVDGQSRTARLRPSTATLLLQLAGFFQTARRQDRSDPLLLLDPFAGIGTIPAVAATAIPPRRRKGGAEADGNGNGRTLRVVASDKDERAVIMARNNAAAALAFLDTGIDFQVHCTDAQHLPLGTGTVDFIVSDMPFGSTHKKLDDAAIPQVLDEMARVSKPGSGVAVLLVQSSAPVLTHLSSAFSCSPASSAHQCWSLGQCRDVIIGGLDCAVLLLKRTPGGYLEAAG